RQAARYIPGRPQVYGRSITGPRRCDPDAAARGAQQAARPDTAARARRRSQGRDRVAVLAGLPARVVAFEDGQQVAEVGFGAEFADQGDVGLNPVIFADHRLVGQGESFIYGDRIERGGDHAGDVTRGPVVVIG